MVGLTRMTLSRTDMISQMEGLTFYGLFPVHGEDNRLLISSDFNQVWDARHMSRTSISQDLCARRVSAMSHCAVKAQTFTKITDIILRLRTDLFCSVRASVILCECACVLQHHLPKSSFGSQTV